MSNPFKGSKCQFITALVICTVIGLSIANRFDSKYAAKNLDYLTDTEADIVKLDFDQDNINLTLNETRILLNDQTLNKSKFYLVKTKSTKGITFTNITNCTSLKNDILFILR